MKKFLPIFLFCAFACGALVMPMVSEAQGPKDTGIPGPKDTGTTAPKDTGTAGPKDTGTIGPADSGVKLNIGNPTKFKTIICLIYALFKVFMNIFAVIAGLYILYAGFRFVSAQGKPDKLKAARQNFWYVLIGTILILGAWGVVVLTINTVNDLLEEDIAWIPDNASCEAK